MTIREEKKTNISNSTHVVEKFNNGKTTTSEILNESYGKVECYKVDFEIFSEILREISTWCSCTIDLAEKLFRVSNLQ
jgi:hypothetical protein